MGRGVMTLNDATVVAYDYLEPDEEFYRQEFEADFSEEERAEIDFDRWMWDCYYDTAADDFDWYRENVTERLLNMFPSLAAAEEEWIGNELRILASNAHSIVTISEYGGVVALCLGPNYDRATYWREDGTGISGLGAHWRESVSKKFLETFGTMTRLGTFSNGESVFEVKKS